nr:MAG TPA: hypothetical protein [Bacteriophage sp.]
MIIYEISSINGLSKTTIKISCRNIYLSSDPIFKLFFKIWLVFSFLKIFIYNSSS